MGPYDLTLCDSLSRGNVIRVAGSRRSRMDVNDAHINVYNNGPKDKHSFEHTDRVLDAMSHMQCERLNQRKTSSLSSSSESAKDRKSLPVSFTRR